MRLLLGLIMLAPILAVALEASDPAPLIKDEARHFSWLTSMVLDGDWQFDDDLTRLWPKFAERPWFVETTGRAPNEAAIGPAIVWAPGYTLTHGATTVLAALGADVDSSGYGAPYILVCVFVSALIASVGVYAAYRLARDHVGAEIAAWSTLLVAGGSFYLYWWIRPGLYAHAIAIGTASLFVWYWARTFGDHSWQRWATLGAFAGLLALVRWQNVWLGATAAGFELVCLAAGIRLRTQPSETCDEAAVEPSWPALRKAVLLGVVFSSTLIPVGMIQLVAWKVIFGEFVVVTAGDQLLQLDHPYLIDLLFSPRYGLLGFSPALYLSVFGLGYGWWHRRRQALPALGCIYFALAIYLNASLTGGSWYGGATFGLRRLDSLFPFMVLGAAMTFELSVRVFRQRPWLPAAGVSAASVLVTAILMHGYSRNEINVGMVGAERFPQDAWRVVLDRVGWLPSLPAELYHMTRDGTRLGQYTRLAHDDPIPWLDGTIRPGPATSHHLGEGWSVDENGASIRASEAELFVYLMDIGYRYRDLWIEIEFAADPLGGIGSLEINGDELPLEGEERDADTTVVRTLARYESLRSGINVMRFHLEGDSDRRRAVVVLSVRMEPTQRYDIGS